MPTPYATLRPLLPPAGRPDRSASFQSRMVRGGPGCRVLTTTEMLAEVRIVMPVPTPLPSLSDALARRAAIFGPFDGDEPPAASLGLLARCAAALRSMADLLEPGAGW